MHSWPPNSFFVSQLNLSWLSETYFVTSSHLSGSTQLLASSQHHYQWDQCDPPPQHHTSRKVEKLVTWHVLQCWKGWSGSGWGRKWLGEVMVKWKLEMMSVEMEWLEKLQSQSPTIHCSPMGYKPFKSSKASVSRFPAVSAINISHFKNPSNPHPQRTARCKTITFCFSPQRWAHGRVSRSSYQTVLEKKGRT